MQAGGVRVARNAASDLAFGPGKVALRTKAARHQDSRIDIVGELARDFFGRFERAGGFSPRELQARELEARGGGARIQLQHLLKGVLGGGAIVSRNGRQSERV